MDSTVDLEYIDKLDLNQFNIYPTYFKGQEESVRSLLKNIYLNFSGQNNNKVSELMVLTIPNCSRIVQAEYNVFLLMPIRSAI